MVARLPCLCSFMRFICQRVVYSPHVIFFVCKSQRCQKRRIEMRILSPAVRSFALRGLYSTRHNRQLSSNKAADSSKPNRIAGAATEATSQVRTIIRPFCGCKDSVFFSGIVQAPCEVGSSRLLRPSGSRQGCG